jgi:hypothetical protein
MTLSSRTPRVCLHASLDHVQWVHDQDLRHTGDGASGELVDKGKRLGFGGHVDGRVEWSGEVLGSLSRWKRYERENARVCGVERTNTRYSCCRNGSRDSLNTYRMNVVTAGCGFSLSVSAKVKVDSDVGIWLSSSEQPPLPYIRPITTCNVPRTLVNHVSK